ncbi:HD-GYP domain-containing protein [Sporosalibacterium faouarense]|uniref:HD-GYP domain-containing protein n=1 Tax=Sporosalibacterium faouarense TaxID=516123 RepID=UPI00192C0546|nr:HD domain-containing phosphohydrolase [Sporosalibacterium faouarense]
MNRNKLNIRKLLGSLNKFEREHSIRVSLYAENFGRVLELNGHEVKVLSNIALLHDVGKARIPITILEKPGKLTDDEYTMIKTHTGASEDILVNSPGLNQYAHIAKAHHERWDGEGYPDKLKGEEIPLYSRIISIIDVYDALANKRVYRKKVFTKKEALDIINQGKGTQFDPNITEIFIEKVESILDIKKNNKTTSLGERKYKIG